LYVLVNAAITSRDLSQLVLILMHYVLCEEICKLHWLMYSRLVYCLLTNKPVSVVFRAGDVLAVICVCSYFQYVILLASTRCL
jgi:hypothetical protein